MYINTFKYTPKDVSCQLCTEYVKKLGCTALRCPWLAERIEAGVVGYREAVLETFSHERRLFQRLNLLIKHYPGSLWSNEQHERRMQYQCAVQSYRADGKNALSLDYRSSELFKQRATLLYEGVGDSYMTAHFISSPSPSVKRTGTGAILPTTGLGQTPCPSPPILTHGVLTATAIWPSAAIPVWWICFSARPVKPTRRSGRKPLSGIC